MDVEDIDVVFAGSGERASFNVARLDSHERYTSARHLRGDHCDGDDEEAAFALAFEEADWQLI